MTGEGMPHFCSRFWWSCSLLCLQEQPLTPELLAAKMPIYFCVLCSSLAVLPHYYSCKFLTWEKTETFNWYSRQASPIKCFSNLNTPNSNSLSPKLSEFTVGHRISSFRVHGLKKEWWHRQKTPTKRWFYSRKPFIQESSAELDSPRIELFQSCS